MAFEPAVFLAVAHNGTVPQLIATQGTAALENSTVGITAVAVTGTSSLTLGDGTAQTGSYHTLFSINAAGTQLSFVESEFNLLSVANQDKLARAFATGGTLVVHTDVTSGVGTTNQDLTIMLGGLRTNDFIVNGAGSTATAAHHPGAANPNFVAPVLVTAGTFTFKCTDLAPGTTTNPNTLAISVGAPPLQLFNRTLSIHIAVTAPAAITADVTLPINLHLPSQCVISVDRSGSMGGSTSAPGGSKWDEAVKAATLFWNLYGESIPTRQTGGGATVAAQSLVRFGWWRWQSGFNNGYEPAAGFESAATAADPSAGLAPGGGTPIGDALLDAKALFTSGAWRRRHILLLTDGMSNSGGTSFEDVAAAPGTYLPRLGDDSDTDGIIVHCMSFAQAGETPVATLSDLATEHDGVFHGNASDQYVYNVDQLRDRFISILGKVLAIQHDSLTANAAGQATFTVEDGVDRVVFVAPGGAALTAANGTDIQDSADTAGDFTWAEALNPTRGTWTVSGASSGDTVYAIYDVALRLSEEVEGNGIARPIKVRAAVTFNGRPVSGAEVFAGVRRPGESIGEVITSFVRRRGLGRALQQRGGKGLLHPDLTKLLAARLPQEATHGDVLSAKVAAQGVSASNGDTKSLQRLLLDAAEDARGLELQSLGHSILLSEVSPGMYEGEVPASMTTEEGVYDVRFLAEGVTPSGVPFRRKERRSIALAPIPSVEHSETFVQQAAVANGVLWTTTVSPRTRSGNALGPGVGNALAFHYVSVEDRKKLGVPLTIDNLDGTYSTQIKLAKGEKPPALALVYGRFDDKLQNGMLVEDKRRPRRVRVRLDAVQVLDDKDGCLTGAGELVFDALVAPNANPARAVRTRLPDSGVLKVASGQRVELGQLIYDGLVEAGASLAITIGGKEIDAFLFFRREEKLARYHRVLPLKSAHVKPDDEANDPESLSDWKVWYTVEVE
jgi:hypothetical protein